MWHRPYLRNGRVCGRNSHTLYLLKSPAEKTLHLPQSSVVIPAPLPSFSLYRKGAVSSCVVCACGSAWLCVLNYNSFSFPQINPFCWWSTKAGNEQKIPNSIVRSNRTYYPTPPHTIISFPKIYLEFYVERVMEQKF